MIVTSTSHFQIPPQKIISLVPSQTELLAWLGMEAEVIGITKFCVHPGTWFSSKERVGGTKNINVALIKKLQPGIIIANKEENSKQQIEELAKEFDVWVTDVGTLEDAFTMIKDIGTIVGKEQEAGTLITRIKTNLQELGSVSTLMACYLIWKDPYITIGGDTFINDMMKHCGLQNIFENKKRYPEITFEELQDTVCEVVLLSSEPYPFKQKHVEELQLLLPGKKIMLVDGEMFSWYGSRLLKAPGYITKLKEDMGLITE